MNTIAPSNKRKKAMFLNTTKTKSAFARLPNSAIKGKNAQVCESFICGVGILVSI